MSVQQSLYRRHRPQSFAEVVGQAHVVRTLSNALERGRIHHAYLFVGSRGTGKTSLAKILARSLNCVEGPTLEPCGQCESCTTIAAGTSLDVMEMDAASNRSVDDIRELRERVGFAPTGGRWKVYILDEAHMLTREAWNAFLKTLEEPPPNTVFVLATTEPHKVMPTIVDRCQRFDFHRGSPEQVAEVVRRVVAAESIEIADGAIAAVSRAANGSFRDALGTLDQLVAYGGKRIETDDVLAVLGVADSALIVAAADAIAASDGRATLEVSERLARSGRDVAQFGRDLLSHLRQLLVIRTAGEPIAERGLAAADPERMAVQADSFTDLGLSRAIDSIAAALSAIREGDEPRMTIELALLRAARPQLDPSREALLERLERLEAALAGGAVPQPPSEDEAQDQARPPEPEAETADREPPADDEQRIDKAEDGATPVAQARAAAEALDLEKLIGLWPAVVDQIRSQGSEMLSHALAAARPVAIDVEQAVLQIGFPAGARFNKRKAEAGDARERFAEAVKTIAGERLRPVYVLLEGEDATGHEEAEPELSSDELIEKLKSEFDAEEFEGEVAPPDSPDVDAPGIDAGFDASPDTEAA